MKEKRKFDFKKVLYAVIIVLSCVLAFIVSIIVSRYIVETAIGSENKANSNSTVIEYGKTENKTSKTNEEENKNINNKVESKNNDNNKNNNTKENPKNNNDSKANKVINSGNSNITNSTSDNKKEIKEATKKIQSEEISAEEKTKITEQIIEKIEEEKTTDEYKEYEDLTPEEKENINVIPRQYEVDISEFDDIKEYQDEHIENEENKNTNSIPVKYDLRNKLQLKVENQGGKGLCWAYATINSIETNLALTTGKMYDFSECYVDYMTSKDMYGSFFRNLGDGGHFEFVERLLKERPILVEEKNLEECKFEEQQFHGFGELEGEKIMITKTANFPGFSKKNYPNEYKEYINILKTHIMNYGSIYCAMSFPTENNINTYIYRKTYEDITAESGGHAVSIIGWDDTIPKEKFKNDNLNMPENDGGFIIFNSWGENYGEGGYGYISYEDCNAFCTLEGIISINNMKDLTKVSDIKNKAIVEYIENNEPNYIQTIDGVKYIVDIDNISMLDLSNTDIANVSDLMLFKNLSYLDLSNTNISEIEELANLKNLLYLNLENTKVKDVSCLANSKIEILVLNGNTGIKGYDKIKTVSDLYLKNCGIEYFEDTESFEKLNSIFLSNNKIKELKLKDEKEYYCIELNSCNLEDLSVLHLENKDINTLELANNPNISNIEEITKIAKSSVNQLCLRGCNIKDISFLKKFNEIEILDLSDNTELQGDLAGVTVNVLELNNCKLNNDFSFFNLKSITSLALKGNNIDFEKMIDKFLELANTEFGISICTDGFYTEDYINDNLYFYCIENNYDVIERKYTEVYETIEVRNINNAYIYPNELISQKFKYFDKFEINGEKYQIKLNKSLPIYSVKSMVCWNYQNEKVIYNIVENKSLAPEKLYVTPMKNIYTSPEEVNLRNAFVQLYYGNGIYETITDYEIIMPSKLKNGVNNVTFKKDNLEFTIKIFIGKTDENGNKVFTLEFKDESSLIYDIDDQFKYYIVNCDYDNHKIYMKWEALYIPWTLYIKPETIPELVDLAKIVEIEHIIIKYEPDYDKKNYYINKIDEEKVNVFNQLPSLKEVTIYYYDSRKKESDYIDEKCKDKMSEEYKLECIKLSDNMKIYFTSESNLYKKCVNALPEKHIFHSQESNTGNYVIAILWGDIKAEYGNNPDIKLELDGMQEYEELDKKFPAKELTLNIVNYEKDKNYEELFEQLTEMKNLKKFIIKDSNKDRTLYDYVSNEFVEKMSKDFEIVYEK